MPSSSLREYSRNSASWESRGGFSMTNVEKQSPASRKKSFPRKTEKYYCHAWLPEDKVIVGTDGGSIVLLESGNFSGVLPCSPSDGVAIRSMAVYSTGFICGCDTGIVRLFEQSSDFRMACAILISMFDAVLP